MTSFVTCKKVALFFRISIPSLSLSLSCYLRPIFDLFSKSDDTPGNNAYPVIDRSSIVKSTLSIKHRKPSNSLNFLPV
jgi:hypothetical protein